MTYVERLGENARIDGHEKSLNFAFNKLPVKKEKLGMRTVKQDALPEYGWWISIFFFYGSFPDTSAIESREDSPTVVFLESSNQNWKAHFAALAFTGAGIRRGNKRERDVREMRTSVRALV